MHMRSWLWIVMIMACLTVGAAAQEPAPLANWTSAPYWTPTPALQEAGPQERDAQSVSDNGTALLAPVETDILPFTAVTPCRLLDTAHNAGDGGAFGNAETRTYNFSTNTHCPGLPSNVGAWSLNFQINPTSLNSYLAAYPAGTTYVVGSFSTMVGYVGNWTVNAAIVPGGTGGFLGQVSVFIQHAAHMIIEVNGFYAAQPVVTMLNTKTGNVTLAPGSNIDISPSGNTLTISMTGVAGGTLPAGAAGQTLRSDGSGWLATSNLYNDGTKVGIGTTSPNEQLELSGNLRLPTTGASAGQLLLGSHTFLQGYGSMNTFVGESAGNLTSNGYGNTGIGYMSLNADTSGYSNSALGRESLWKNTTGGANVAMGMWALHSNTTADNNTAFGMESLRDNTTGHENTALGSYSLLSNTVGINNTAIGHQSLIANTSAGRNTAVGVSALYSQSFANGGTAWDADNTAVGVEALYSNQPTSTGSGYTNTAVGSVSLRSNTTGYSNTAVGYNSLWKNKTGSSNTAVGTNALNGAGTGNSYNTAVGVDAGYNTTGSNNVLLGFGAGYAESSSNRLHIANSISASLIYGQFDNGRVVINDTSTALAVAGLDVNGKLLVRSLPGISGSYLCADANGNLGRCVIGSAAGSSTNVPEPTADHDVLSALQTLRGVTLDRDTSQAGLHSLGGRRQLGMIAQEVEAILPELVSTDAEGYKSLDYAKLSAFLIEVAKAQQAQIGSQQAEIAALTTRLERIETLLTQPR